MQTIEEAVGEERKNIDFSVRKMSEFLYGPKQYKELREGLERFPEIPHDWNLFNRGRV
jgi:hypothetical protein